MAQSATTVTPVSPTPPTNFACVGERPPTTAGLAQLDDGVAGPLTAFIAPVSGATHEGAGTEVLVTATSPNPNPNGQSQSLSDLGNYTSKPSSDHASCQSAGGMPQIDTHTPDPTPSGVGTFGFNITGNFFSKRTVLYLDDVPQQTNVFSQWTLTGNANKRLTPGVSKMTLRVDGVLTTPPIDWTFT